MFWRQRPSLFTKVVDEHASHHGATAAAQAEVEALQDALCRRPQGRRDRRTQEGNTRCPNWGVSQTWRTHRSRDGSHNWNNCEAASDCNCLIILLCLWRIFFCSGQHLIVKNICLVSEQDLLNLKQIIETGFNLKPLDMNNSLEIMITLWEINYYTIVQKHLLFIKAEVGSLFFVTLH